MKLWVSNEGVFIDSPQNISKLLTTSLTHTEYLQVTASEI